MEGNKGTFWGEIYLFWQDAGWLQFFSSNRNNLSSPLFEARDLETNSRARIFEAVYELQFLGPDHKSLVWVKIG